jgi:hypothetical protein
MRKKIQIMWNHLDYPTQVRAIDLISKFIDQQTDSLMKTAIAAAVTELELWSNAPCDSLSSILGELPSEEDEDLDEDDEPIIKSWIH